MSRWSIAVVGLAALALLLWPWPMGDAPTNGRSGRSGSATDVVPASSELAPHAASDAAASERMAAAVSPLPAIAQWTVQLTGIDPAVPWTAPLRLVIERRFEVRGVVDAHGTWRFVPPESARNPAFQNFVLVAEDDHYRIAHPHQRTDDLQHSGYHELVVYPVAQLRGRVLGPDGQGIVARVSAFSCGVDGPREPVLARTESGPDGRYLLRAPPATPLFVLAEATAAAAPFPLRNPSPQPLVFDSLQATPFDDLESRDERTPRSDLLPAGLRAEGLQGTPRTVPELRLGTPAMLTGRATFADGRPLANVDVIAEPAGAVAPWRDNLHWSPTDGLVHGARTSTDARGAFAMQLPPGVRFHVQATAEDPLLLAGEPSTMANAPGHVELQAPGDLVTLRVVADGKPVPRAWIDLSELPPLLADAAGEHRVTLPLRPLRLRARADLRASAWVELPSGNRPALVTLDLAAADLASLADVQLVLKSRPELLTATFVWQPLPDGAPLVISSERNTGDAPFVLRVPVGRYHLTVRDRPGVPGGHYMLPLQFPVDVPPAGLASTHDIAFGGRLQLDVIDAKGIWLAGTFTLRDAGGRDVTPRAMTVDERGDRVIAAAGLLQPGNVNQLAAVLPPGDYALTVETVEHGSIRQMVTIRAGVTTTVSPRLR